MAHVVVLGGGFGGLAAANELRQKLDGDHQVTVVAADDRFFVGFAKLWDLVGVRPLAAGTGHLRSLQDRNIDFVMADIIEIDPAARRVQTSAGLLHADFVVVALGAADGLGRVASLHGSAYNLYDPGALPAMRSRLEAIDSGTVVIPVLGSPYKCPPAPYEAAFLIDERLRDRGVRDQVAVVVTTMLPATLPLAGAEVSDMVAAALADRDIELRTEHLVEEIDPHVDKVVFTNGSSLDYTLALAVPQAVPPAVVANSPLAGDDGWIWPDRYTAATDFEGVYAVGDCTAVKTLPKAGAFAEAMGRVAAANIVAEITGHSPARYDGSGYCFLEFPEHRASTLEGHFFTEPAELTMAQPTSETYTRKQAFEADRLREWLGE